MDPVGILADLAQLHTVTDHALVVMLGVLLLSALTLFVQASGWWQMRGWHLCPCGCGSKVRNCPQRKAETTEPPKSQHPAYCGKHRRGSSDGADTTGVREPQQEVHQPSLDAIRTWQTGGPFHPAASERLLNVWGRPPGDSRGVPGGVSGVPVPGGAGSAAETTGSEYAERANDAAVSAV